MRERLREPPRESPCQSKRQAETQKPSPCSRPSSGSSSSKMADPAFQTPSPKRQRRLLDYFSPSGPPPSCSGSGQPSPRVGASGPPEGPSPALPVQLSQEKSKAPRVWNRKPTGRPRVGPRRGRAAGCKSNVRAMGDPVLRRDPSAQEKLHMLEALKDKLGQAESDELLVHATSCTRRWFEAPRVPTSLITGGFNHPNFGPRGGYPLRDRFWIDFARFYCKGLTKLFQNFQPRFSRYPSP